MEHMNDSDFDLCDFFGFDSNSSDLDNPCPSCTTAEMEWHPNGHMAHCPNCGHEEIL